MSKKFLLFILTFSFSINLIKPQAATSRIFDFNNTSDLTNYFSVFGDPFGTNINYAGLKLSGSVKTDSGVENIWTSKKGYFTTGTGDVFKISGYFYNMDNFGYGSVGFSNSDVNSGDGTERATPPISIGFVFHGGGGYFVNNGVYTEVLWPPDLDDSTWYKFELIVENAGSNHFYLTILVKKSDDMGSILSTKKIDTLEVVNSQIASASKLYSYFGSSVVRFSYVDNIEIELSNGPTFEEDGKPLVSTTNATSISSNSATAGGQVTNEFGSSVTTKGVCYSTSSNPTISGTCTSDGNGMGSFTSNLSDLSSNTLYYYRAYATNSNGTSYGTEKTFTTSSNPSSNSNSSNKKVTIKDKCKNKVPPKTSWIKLTQTKKNGKEGMLLTWSQNGADKINVLIDNGTNKFPFVISKTKNDGKEFLPNVTSKQKIKILPINGCKSGNYSQAISKESHSAGYFNTK